MIRIYADQSDHLEIVVRDAEVGLFPLARFEAPSPTEPRARRRGIGVLTAVLLVLVSGSGGFVLAQRVATARASLLTSATAPSYRALPPIRPLPEPAPSSMPDAIPDALAQGPSVTPPPVAPKPGTPPGVAAFGLQP